jgi:hypothetical protein
MEPNDAPVYNHVALTMQRELLEEPRRTDLIEFYHDVYGWEVAPAMTVDGRRLVFRMYRRGQFLFLIGSDDYSQIRPADHFGIQVGSLDAMRSMIAKARRWKEERDSSVEITSVGCQESASGGPIYNVYIRYLLPMRVEIQHYAPSGQAPQSIG